MKKFSSFALLLVISVSFSAPLLAVADTTINSEYCNSTGRNYDTRTQTCVSNSGGINLEVIRPYSEGIKNFINGILMPVFMAIAFIVFLWGVFKYFIWGAENEMEKADGRKFVMWGIIGFVIILSLWGLVNLVTGVLALPNNNAPRPPQL
ncbi:MAG: pilin [Patescibacteria group bacterium]